ncbi:unnamed protein product [Auanema sp. JU1783]|nr:unnamed protein product [Auanema sp. JU1783]
MKSALFLLNVLSVSYALQCYTGIKGSVDAAHKGDLVKSPCAGDAKYCIMEAIGLNSMTGHSISGYRYDCDSHHQCDAIVSTGHNCADEIIGKICCCTSDYCNNYSSVPALSTFVLVLLFSIFVM